MSKISESGVIGADGLVRLPMDRVNMWCAQNRGKRLIAKFIAVEHESTEAQRAYYYNYVLPTVVSALRAQGTRKPEKAADEWLIALFPGDKDMQGSGVDATIARELDECQMSDFLEWLKQFAAEHFAVYVEDPKVL